MSKCLKERKRPGDGLHLEPANMLRVNPSSSSTLLRSLTSVSTSKACSPSKARKADFKFQNTEYNPKSRGFALQEKGRPLYE